MVYISYTPFAVDPHRETLLLVVSLTFLFYHCFLGFIIQTSLWLSKVAKASLVAKERSEINWSQKMIYNRSRSTTISALYTFFFWLLKSDKVVVLISNQPHKLSIFWDSSCDWWLVNKNWISIKTCSFQDSLVKLITSSDSMLTL